MAPAATVNQLAPSYLDSLLGRTLGKVRLITILVLLLASFAQPLVGRVGLPTWILILAFAGYSVILLVLRYIAPHFLSALNSAFVDLVVAGILYSMGATPDGPLFVLLLMVTVCAVATSPIRLGWAYTGAATLIIGIATPTLPLWPHSSIAMRDLIAHLIIVALVGTMTVLLVRQLEYEHHTALTVQRQVERQAELDRLRGVFVSSVSHDLRTPLTALRAGIGMLETSLQDRLRPDEEKLLATAQRNSERLGLLIGDLLTISQLEAGVLHIEHAIVDLQSVVEAAVTAVQPLLNEKRQFVTVDLATLATVIGDSRRLEQALVNVIANAYQHTPVGTHIEISSKVQAQDVMITISDDGPGIPAEDLERIFVRFHRLTPATSGSGLGLDIARRIIELHEGRMWAESAVGQGTTFHIALPCNEH